MAQIDAAAKISLWPGYDPLAYPIAFFDGADTLLYRFPDNPAGFKQTELPGRPLRYPGRHELMVANTSAKLDGVEIGTVLLDSKPGVNAQQMAAVAVHELFHAYQRTRHPTWIANEAVIFTWPHADAEIFALRRLETIAMRRALDAPSEAERNAWTMRALVLREQRVKLLPPEHAEYERRSELNEGLARYIQGLVDRQPLRDSFPAEEWPLTHVRQRTYATGQLWATMLDGVSPGWKERFNADGDLTLDQALRDALSARGVKAADFTTAEIEVERATARDVVAGLSAEQKKAKADFLAAEGWRIVIELGAGAPLGLRGFDPINVFNLDGGEILHYRMLNLANASGSVNIIGHACLSQAAGPHPLFNGVSRVTITGLKGKPEIHALGAGADITADGVTISFSSADISEKGTTLTIRQK